MENEVKTTETNNSVKPGYKTTEFWLSTAAAVLGIVMAADIIETGSAVSQVVGIITTALTAMGYSVARGKTKSNS